jgi:hypothetical protein
MFDAAFLTQLEAFVAQSQRQPPQTAIPGKGIQITRRKFTPEEDDALRRLVAQLGSNDWNAIAREFPGRSARQCRDRWCKYLSPELVIGRWTQEDEERLIAKVREIGPRWALIAQHFPGRTDVGVKNHYISVAGKPGKGPHGGGQPTK